MTKQASDISGQPRGFFKTKSFGLYFGIFTSIAALLVITVVTIVGYIWVEYTKALTEISGHQMNQATEMVREKVVNYLAPAATMAKLSSQILKDGDFDRRSAYSVKKPDMAPSPTYPASVALPRTSPDTKSRTRLTPLNIHEKIIMDKEIDIHGGSESGGPKAEPAIREAYGGGRGLLSLTDREMLEEYGVHLLRAFPQIAMVNIGDEEGTFMMPKKLPDGKIATKIIDQTVVPPVIWRDRDKDDKVEKVRPGEEKEREYDPRTRGWYKGAKTQMGSFWTDVYIFFSDQKPGITTSHAVFDARGDFVGVFSLDIGLNEISAFLETLKIGKKGIAYIINQDQELIAYPNPDLVVKMKDGKPKPRLISELGVKWVEASFEEYQKTGAHRFSYEADGERYLGAFANMGGTFGKEWKIAVIVPEEDFLGPLIHMKRVVPIISIVILVISMFIARAISRGISRPINALTEETERIKNFEIEEETRVPHSIIREIQTMTQSVTSMKTGLRAFEKYVPSELVRQLIQAGEEAKLGGKKKELTILFSDIQGFTSISERTAPETLMIQLFEYNNELTNILKNNKGTIDKYIGDAIMAFWGAPTRLEDHAYLACEAMLLCDRKLAELNKKWEEDGKEIFITRFGLHSGMTIVGNMGSEERMNYSVLGDSVNLASRVEGINKTYGTRLAVTQATFDKVSDHFIFRPLDIVAVKGKNKGIQLYELLGKKNEDLPADVMEMRSLFTRGFKAYCRQDWDDALDLFNTIRRKFRSEEDPNKSSDKATNLYIERCTEYKANPPGKDWDRVYRPKTKG